MTRITALNPDTTTGKSRQLFAGVQAKLGMVPNMMRTMGTSPAVLDGYLSLNGALAQGKLGAKLGELLALAIAEANGCDYCLAAHTFIGEKLVRIDQESLELAREGESADPRIQAALEFAITLVQTKGCPTDADVAAVKAAGYSEGEVGEIVAHVALNVFTNYFNNTANTVVDFPEVITA